jgi:cytochrome c biogenesis protein CcmG/thiol:disulfide interchange protein DsbE
MTTDPLDQPRQRSGFVRVLIALSPLLIFAALAAAFLTQLLSGRDASEIPSALVGEPAPVLDLPALNGLEQAGEPIPGPAADGFDGQLTLVNVWASWCVPCRQEHPYLMELAQDERIRIVGINYKDQNSNALRFLGELGSPYDAVGVDDSGRTAIDWGVYGVPESFLVDENGTIIYKQVGPFDEQSYREELLPLLGPPQPTAAP